MGSRASESLAPIEAKGRQLIHYRKKCGAACQNIRASPTRKENLMSICEVGPSTGSENRTPDRDVARTPSVTRPSYRRRRRRAKPPSNSSTIESGSGISRNEPSEAVIATVWPPGDQIFSVSVLLLTT